jgi:heme-degrading monooxygenase HmoA
MSHAVIYRWKVRSGKEHDFASAWARLTDIQCAECGAIGSRLHKADDGSFIAYSFWPSRKHWDMAQLHGPRSAARALMAAAIEERFPEIHMELLDERFAGMETEEAG